MSTPSSVENVATVTAEENELPILQFVIPIEKNCLETYCPGADNIQ